RRGPPPTSAAGSDRQPRVPPSRLPDERGAGLTPAPRSRREGLLDEERVQVRARVRGLEQEAAGPSRDELTVVPVVVGRPGGELRRELYVQVAIRLVAGVARQLVGSRELLVDA